MSRDRGYKYISFYLLIDFILFIKVVFLLNLIEQPFAIYWLELLFYIPEYLYALSNLTWVLIRVHKTMSHMIPLSLQVCFK